MLCSYILRPTTVSCYLSCHLSRLLLSYDRYIQLEMNVTCNSSIPMNEEMWPRNQWIQPVSVFYYVFHLASAYCQHLNHLEPVHLFELNTLLDYRLHHVFQSSKEGVNPNHFISLLFKSHQWSSEDMPAWWQSAWFWPWFPLWKWPFCYKGRKINRIHCPDFCSIQFLSRKNLKMLVCNFCLFKGYFWIKVIKNNHFHCKMFLYVWLNNFSEQSVCHMLSRCGVWRRCESEDELWGLTCLRNTSDTPGSHRASLRCGSSCVPSEARV